MSEVLVSCENVGKKFCRDFKKSLWYGVKDSASDLLGRYSPSRDHAIGSNANRNAPDLRPGEFWANKGVSFEVKRGECLGLIGKNGAGKTTLLKMLNGLIKPDHGCIKMKGRVGAMIALGAGFNPILTGRENVHVNGAVLGLSQRQISDALDDIVDFSGLADFIDSPVRTYSSGMNVRLGFAVASSLYPDVLLIDEVLAVGDAAFRSKCFGRIAKLLDRAAVILVSHQMSAIGNICSGAALLNQGIKVFEGNIEPAISRYDQLNESESDGGFYRLTDPIIDLQFSISQQEIVTGGALTAKVKLSCSEAIPEAVIRLVIYNESSSQVAELGSQFLDMRLDLQRGDNHFKLHAPEVRLKGGRYLVSLCISKRGGLGIIGWDHLNKTLNVVGRRSGFSGYQLNGTFERTA